MAGVGVSTVTVLAISILENLVSKTGGMDVSRLVSHSDSLPYVLGRQGIAL